MPALARTATLSAALLLVATVGVPSAGADAYHSNSTGSCTWTAENYRPYGLYFARTTINTSTCVSACVRLSTTSTWTCINNSSSVVEKWQSNAAASSRHQVVNQSLAIGLDTIAF